ncbi:hypothetical protein QRY03_11215 [Enterococcus hirae]|uniref:hypothetical protein n=1 Tax=Enterococcus hirae TaxID=1354 RepID=UPI00255A810F|nr:hypothetical protein [Enterococcus hirae]MDL4900529.1 hypothetical protein [Enterococcus hirae]MDL4903008.1 hypothetical protein [Enterococcus hirae]MDL4905620.1 hypothetical protein [Enterococcus hirae]MDL4918464.1 hypothetical protein [Enterococcus hirae]MDL4927616.1 hypothetical protein [Enterococcus hirae]
MTKEGETPNDTTIKINIVLDARPRLVHIIKCATDDQFDRLVEEVNKDLQHELEEVAFV